MVDKISPVLQSKPLSVQGTKQKKSGYDVVEKGYVISESKHIW